jgi:hypothetical protein
MNEKRAAPQQDLPVNNINGWSHPRSKACVSVSRLGFILTDAFPLSQWLFTRLSASRLLG